MNGGEFLCLILLLFLVQVVFQLPGWIAGWFRGRR